MSATQLSFTLKTSSNVKTVHLVGSWDNYGGQLPLSRADGKAGSWKGTFRFQTSTLKPGSRYWYYYMMDGYHVSHDPAKPSTTEPTTGRKLNILDAPKSASSKSSSGAAPRREAIATGRGLSPSRIVAPKPSKPYASRAVREADYSRSPVDDLCGSLEAASLHAYSVSPPSSVGSSASSSRSSGASSPASLSSLSDNSSGSRCSCKRYGVTRSGEKRLLDCGGARCGYSDDSSSACSSSDEEDSESDSDSGSDIDDSSEDEAPVRRRAAAPAPAKKSSSSASAKPRIQTVKPRQATSSSRRR